MNNIKIIIPHCKNLPERKINLINQLNQNNLYNFTFYENYDGNEIENISTNYYDNNINNQIIKTKNWPGFVYRPLKLSEISLCIKYFHIFELIANGNDDYVLILEDDVILHDNFISNFTNYFKETPNTFDAIFIGSGCNLKPKNIIPGCKVYKKEHPATKCTDSFIISKKCCQKIVKTFLPFSLPADWELNFQFFKHNCEVYWWEPAIVSQGSQTGKYKSSIQ